MKTVLVVDDSLTLRKTVAEIIDEQPDFKVVGEACDGLEATRMVAALRPDVITMDMMMPMMNGLEATRVIMAEHPTPILVVSASTNRGELMKTYDALAAGALSVVEKPGAREMDDDSWEHKLLSELRLVVKIPVVRHLEGKKRTSFAQPGGLSQAVSQTPVRLPTRSFSHVVIGGSTGAPGALNTILQALPGDFPLPISCVIHINDTFSASLAQWLDRNSKMTVLTATDGIQYGRPGHVFLAPAGRHLKMKETYLRFSDEPPRHFCRPSVDVLFESAVQVHRSGLIGVVLTGMGNDGAIGLRSINEAGGYTITQTEASCTVYGMPHESDMICNVDKHLSPTQIAAHLVSLTSKN